MPCKAFPQPHSWNFDERKCDGGHDDNEPNTKESPAGPIRRDDECGKVLIEVQRVTNDTEVGKY
jgi:hypothetical protein